VAIVPHTHWDREWYEPYQSFRLRLVRMLDNLIPLLEHDPSYARFLLDGQMAVVDDYLEVRPEAEERLRALAAAGRLTMGPWYILMDEFLVSGETIVRDLQLEARPRPSTLEVQRVVLLRLKIAGFDRCRIVSLAKRQLGR
jgi:alpha-mannosidase